jgi:hypothetical protein
LAPAVHLRWVAGRVEVGRNEQWRGQ